MFAVSFGGQWMFWDPDLRNWRFAEPTVKESNLEAFERESDPALPKCRPCAENSHAECEGRTLCGCSLCTQIQPVVEEMSDDWNLSDQAKTWPD